MFDRVLIDTPREGVAAPLLVRDLLVEYFSVVGLDGGYVRAPKLATGVEPAHASLTFAFHVLKGGTLEDAFRHWHQGFRPLTDLSQVALAA